MACSRNVDHGVCSDDVADLASLFFALFIACRCYKQILGGCLRNRESQAAVQ